jgi:hypothetical protein
MFILAQISGYPLPGGRGWERKLDSFTAVVRFGVVFQFFLF